MSEGAANASLQERIAALRSEGSWRCDLVRFCYLETLSQRMQGQPAAVQRLLEQRLQSALADFAERVARRKDAARSEAESLRARRPAHADAARAPLKLLNEYIRTATSAASQDGQTRELASVRRFRSAWSASRSQEQLEQALARKPAQAGPLNSHVLVLQALELMGELSPDYLRHFLLHVESLQWLEQAREARTPAKAAKVKVARARREKK